MDTMTGSDRLLKEMQQHAARLRKHREQEDNSGASEESKPLIHDILLLNRLLREAEPFKNAGAEVTPMDKYHGVTKPLALFAGRVIVHLLRFITDKQIAFNSLIFSAMKEISGHLHRLNRSITLKERRYQHEIELLKKEVEALKRAAADKRDA